MFCTWELITPRKILDRLRKFINLESLANTPTCFKNPYCIDLLLINPKKSFDEALVLESGLYDCHKLVVSVLKSYLKKEDPKVIIYRDYEYFENEKFSNEPEIELSKIGSLTLNYDIF